jgi:transposase InsO family protein
VARSPNDVWTLDFKGWFRTGDGTRVEPLTVRDLKSRFLLDLRLLPNQSDGHTRRALTRVFDRYGLPKVIRVDNGPPFGGVGPRGLSRLSVWWRRLGIRVEFGRPAHPEDNAGHEQMHGVYQAEVAAHPAGHPCAHQRRSDRWRASYNQLRPHEALRLRPPA